MNRRLHHRPPGNHAPETGRPVPLARPGVPDEPALPHDRDESADPGNAGQAPADPVIRQAHSDVRRGLVDTDRGPPMNDIYTKRLKRPKR